ncbi:MAG: hypothetical protein QM736_04905 [Vicinamibacterales bacterium]
MHCADKSVDNLVYVCDRVNDRLQVFTPDGKFVKEQFYREGDARLRLGWDIAFSKDPQQKYLSMADGMNQRINVIDRQSLRGGDELRRRRPAGRDSSSASTALPSTRRATCIRLKHGKASASRSSSTGGLRR